MLAATAGEVAGITGTVDALGTGATGAALLRSFTFAFAEAGRELGAELALGVTVADARAEELACDEVLPVDVVVPDALAIPMTAIAAKIKTAPATLCSFFMAILPDGPPLPDMTAPPRGTEDQPVAWMIKEARTGFYPCPYLDVQAH